MIKFRYNNKRYEHGKPHKNSNSSLGSLGKFRYLAGHGHSDRDFSKSGSSTDYSHHQQSGGKTCPQRSSGQRKNENLVKVIKEASLAVVSVMAAEAKDLTATTTNEEIGKKLMPIGSGFFISKDGIVLTNKHIVGDETLEYVVMTSDGNTYPATVISRSPSQDVAVLKMEGNNFNFIPLGDSKNINIGQTAIALGSDSGEFQNTVSVGVVSGLNKLAAVLNSVSVLEDSVALIQIDAATNPGNSGGPLIDLNGRAIGINTVGAPRENIGFALPINLAKKDIADASKLKIKN